MEILPISGPSTEIREEVLESPRRRSRLKYLRRPDPLFLAVIVLPVVAAIIYFGFLTSDVYISESQFVVRSPQKPAASPLGALLQSAGFSNAEDEASAAQAFAQSRDALRALNQNGAVERAYTRPSISIVDRFDPFGHWGGFEYLYKYFQGKVSISNDSSTSAMTLDVRAYTPQDAYEFNRQLLDMMEARVNTLNDRGQHDLVKYAQADVDMAKARSQAAALSLAAYRSRAGIVDPQIQAQAKMDMISNLQNQLIAAKTDLAQVERYAPQNPRVPVIQTEIGTIEGEIKREMGTVTTGHSSLAGKAVEYQRLSLESDFADKQLAAALASLEQAKEDARRKQVYLERIVQPNLPDAPMEPRRLRGIFATFALGLLAYCILRVLLAGIREHAQ